MRYRDTRGNDRLIGTDERDVFLLDHRGYDFVDGGGGSARDRLIVDYSGQHSDTYQTGDLSVAEDGSLFGTFLGDDRSSVEFKGIEILEFRTPDAPYIMSVDMLDTDPAQRVFIDASAGDSDTLLLRFNGSVGTTITVDRSGVVSSAAGHYVGFEVCSYFLGHGDDLVWGGRQDEYISAGFGEDRLSGGGGDDTLIGSYDRDQLIGGAGADTFHYRAIRESRPDAPDAINDFSRAEGDRIDLHEIDPGRGVPGNQAFTFIGEAEFSGPGGTAYELRQQVIVPGAVLVEGDIDHDGKADFAIVVNTPDLLVAADFTL